jgi:hypothetical protein
MNIEPYTGSPSQPVTGIVAILDALGAATYSREEAARFLESRALVQQATQGKLEPGFNFTRLKQFIFNDTVVLAYVDSVTMFTVQEFCQVLRTFMTLSIRQGILFRGAFAVGDFFEVNEQTNTIMGPAVSDAAAWHGRANWIGINATPHATIAIQSLMEASPESHARSLDRVLVDYDVPLTDKNTTGEKTARRLKVLNWPRGLFVIRPRPYGLAAVRAQLLKLLAEHRIPVDTELKYFNSIEFFDHVNQMQGLWERHLAVPEDDADRLA